jgi:putative methyltransferase (TIGR04325 family)
MIVPLSVRHAIKRVLPPIVVDLIRHLRGPTVAEKDKPVVAPAVVEPTVPPASELPPEWEVVADTDAVWQTHEGWSHQSIVDTQMRKWPDFLRSLESARPLGQSHEAAADAPPDYATHNTILTFGYALGRAAQGRQSLSVLDWGGGLGHYYAYARALFPELDLDYVVKDFRGFCDAGRRLLPDVTFLSDEQEATSRSYDFVFASGSLHYTRDHYGLLDRLCRSSREWLMVTRLPVVVASDDFLVVQRPYMYGYMTEYPGWFVNRQRFLAASTRQGFALERRFLVAEEPNVTNAPERARYDGFLFRRSDADRLAPHSDR